MWPSLFGWPKSLGTLSVIARTCRHLPEVCLWRDAGQVLLHEDAYDFRLRRMQPRRQGEDGFCFKRANFEPCSTQAPPTP